MSSMPEWSPERDLPLEWVQSRIERRFPELAPVRVEPWAAGWDNALFRVNGELLFRFPRRSIAVPLLERECRLLPALAPHVPLPIPVPLYVGEPAGEDPWPFYGYRALPGITLAAAALDDGRRRNLARPLARFLRALHAIPVADPDLGLPGDAFGRLDLARRLPVLMEKLRDLHERGTVDDPAPLLAFVASLAADQDEVARRLAGEPRVWVHGDLHATNLLVNADGHPTAVIDWGDMHLGHAAMDLTIAFALPGGAREQFLECYGSVSPVTWRLARFRALYAAAVQMDYALATGDDALVREARGTMDRILEG